MDQLEQKEIRGLNLRSLYWLLASSAGIIFTVLFTYFSIVQRLSTMEIKSLEQDKYDELRLRTIDLKVSAMEVQIKELNDKYDKISKP